MGRSMVRFEGAVVNPLAGILIGDWILETGEPLQELIDAAGLGRAQPRGTANVQVLPSGPGELEDGLLQMILGPINAAQHELVLTTSYLVPDDPMILALRGAAGRGVQATLIVPEIYPVGLHRKTAAVVKKTSSARAGVARQSKLSERKRCLVARSADCIRDSRRRRPGGDVRAVRRVPIDAVIRNGNDALAGEERQLVTQPVVR